jgi:hypothetical protein
MRPFLFTALLLAPVSAQTLTIPNVAIFANVDRPFPGGIGRYQQWYSATSLASGFSTPIRIERAEFFAGAGSTALTTTIDMEVSIGHGWLFGTTGSFASNFSTPPVIVAPRRNFTLSAGSAGQPVIVVDFVNRFTWNGVDPIMMDIKIYGNGQNNQAFSYDFRGTTASIAHTQRIYQSGSATASSGQWQNGIGMITRFTGHGGVVLDYGAGCAGDGGFVPRNVAVEIPSPAITWHHEVRQAASQRLCVWVLGDNRFQIPGNPPIFLPIDIGLLLGQGTFGCDVLVNPVATFVSTTVGGGPGGGLASVAVQLPPVTSYVGFSLFSQWLVFDPNSINGVVALSQGVWSIVAPVGG